MCVNTGTNTYAYMHMHTQISFSSLFPLFLYMMSLYTTAQQAICCYKSLIWKMTKPHCLEKLCHHTFLCMKHVWSSMIKENLPFDCSRQLCNRKYILWRTSVCYVSRLLNDEWEETLYVGWDIFPFACNPISYIVNFPSINKDNAWFLNKNLSWFVSVKTSMCFLFYMLLHGSYNKFHRFSSILTANAC